MVPRIDVVGVEADTTVEDAMRAAIAAGHRRLLVWRGDLDEVVGVVRMRDLAAASLQSGTSSVSRYARSPLITPQTRLVVDLMADMQEAGTHFAVVVDEHGGTEGIVTIEDVVTELVGPISEGGEASIRQITQVSESVWDVAGGADLLDVGRALETELPEGDWTTAAGLVLAAAGEIPSEGDTVELPHWAVEVRSMDGNRLVLLRFSRIHSTAGGLMVASSRSWSSVPIRNTSPESRSSSTASRPHTLYMLPFGQDPDTEPVVPLVSHGPHARDLRHRVGPMRPVPAETPP